MILFLKRYKVVQKIIYVIRSFDPGLSTHEVHFYPFIEELAKYIDIFLIVERGNWPDKSIVRIIKNLHLENIKDPVRRTYRVVKAYREAVTSGYDKLYINYSRYGAFLGGSFIKLIGGKSFYWHCFGDKYYFKDKKSKKSKLLLKLTSLFIDYFISGTPKTSEMYSEALHLPNNRFRVIPNCVDVNRYDPHRYDKFECRSKLDIPKDCSVILFVHTLSEDRGTHLLVPIMQKIKSEIYSPLMIIVGDGPDRSFLEKEIKIAELESCMRLEGSISNIDLPNYYGASDLFIMPSLTECFPRVILEAMAMNLPIVTCDVGGVAEILPYQYKKIITVPGDIYKLGELLVLLFQDLNLRSELSELGRHHVIKHFSVSAITEKFVNEIFITKNN